MVHSTAAREEGTTTSMLWKLKSLNLRTTPAREEERTYDTVAAFESAVKDAQAGPYERRSSQLRFLMALSSMRMSYGSVQPRSATNRPRARQSSRQPGDGPTRHASHASGTGQRCARYAAEGDMVHTTSHARGRDDIHALEAQEPQPQDDASP